MSNKIVNNIYSQVIKSVITSVQADFEENDIDLSVLQDLEKMWETRVASSNVANFESFNPPATQASPTGQGEAQAASSGTSSTLPNERAVEFSSYYAQYSNQDPAYRHPEMADMRYNSMMMQGSANQQYAVGGLNARSINNMAGSNQISAPTAYGAASGNPSQTLNMANAYGNQHYQQAHQMHLSNYPMQIPQSYPNYPIPQTDMYGNAVIKPEYSLGATGSEAYNSSAGPPQVDGSSDSPIKEKKLTREKADEWLKKKIICKNSISQVDGEDGLDNDLDARLDDGDEDAINSDLDDSEEGEAEEEDKDGVEHIILCQYDKVTRTKNRWRCMLKDGIVLVNGKDYLFNKATGEFQW